MKFVCGEIVASPDNVPTPVAPGRYWTAINIHNPSKCKQANFRWKVAVANPGEPGPVTAYSRTVTSAAGSGARSRLPTGHEGSTTATAEVREGLRCN